MTKVMGRVLMGMLLILTIVGCDSQTQSYNQALKQMNGEHYAAAAQTFSVLAETGHAEAQFRLGVMYLNGLGVTKDPQQAIYWLEKAALQGSVGGQYTLARFYLQDRSGSRDEALALQWFQRLAERGYVPAQYQLGMMYERGRGTDKDLLKARQWIQRAAENGHEGAIRKLVQAYKKGLLDLPKDPQQAQYWTDKTRLSRF